MNQTQLMNIATKEDKDLILDRIAAARRRAESAYDSVMFAELTALIRQISNVKVGA